MSCNKVYALILLCLLQCGKVMCYCVIYLCQSSSDIGPISHYTFDGISGFITRGQFWPSGIVVACVCVCVCLSVNHQLVRAVTHQPFKLERPNLDQRCKSPFLRSLLFFGTTDLEVQGQIELKCQNLPHFALVRVINHHQLKSVFQMLAKNAS